jgi:prepilin-type N-terminal cleavage/methylation domain-containing protein
MKRAGFTLIEVLVAIAIIGIVAAITFSVMASARESARTTKCISNLHQWGLAIQMYRQEWDGIDPSQGLKITSLYQLGLPPQSMQAEFIHNNKLGHHDIYYCPSARPVRLRPKLGYRGFFVAYDDPPPAVLQTIQERGGDAPLMACSYHNAEPWEEDNPTDGTLRVLVLRFNQQVNMRRIRAFGVGTPYW